MSVHAYATIKVKVRCTSNWNGDTSMKQIRQQASEEALNEISHTFGKRTYITVVGDPVITTVMAGEDDV